MSLIPVRNRHGDVLRVHRARFLYLGKAPSQAHLGTLARKFRYSRHSRVHLQRERYAVMTRIDFSKHLKRYKSYTARASVAASWRYRSLQRRS